MTKKALALIALFLCLTLAAGVAGAAEAALKEGTYPPDGFSFSGGTGKVRITCPEIEVSGGTVTATLVFSSPNYPKLVSEGVAYTAVHEGDTSVFRIPARVNADMTVVGTTTAMSTPHDIEYVMHIYVGEAPAAPAAEEEETPAPQASTALSRRERELPGLTWERELPLRYAHEFAVDCYRDGYRLITVSDGSRYLLVPEGGEPPRGLEAEIRVLRLPLENVYLAATSAMALISAIDGLPALRFSGTREEGWTVAAAREAMAAGEILYAGKYSEPDYEMLVGMGCDLAVESTMILHTPKVREMLEQLGVPVFIERSSYETHPLGRTEWVKLYGVLLGREAEAEAFFEAEAGVIDAYADFPNTEQTVAFFYISSDGSVVVRNAHDYVAGMIELAGGRYAFDENTLPQTTRASVAISMEDFYAVAVDADYLIYNAAIDTPPADLEDLLAKSPLLADFKAVKAGRVWSTDRQLYQATDIVGRLITDLHRMLTGEETGMTFIHRLG